MARRLPDSDLPHSVFQTDPERTRISERRQMKKTLFGLFLTVAVVLGPVARPAASAAPATPAGPMPVAGSIALWQRIGAEGAKSSLGDPLVAVRTGAYDVFALDEGALGATLANAPDE